MTSVKTGPRRRFSGGRIPSAGGDRGALPQLQAKVRCPTLVLWAGNDRHFPPRQAERLPAAVAGSRLEVVPAAEHWMPWYLADEVARRLLSFGERGCQHPGLRGARF